MYLLAFQEKMALTSNAKLNIINESPTHNYLLYYISSLWDKQEKYSNQVILNSEVPLKFLLSVAIPYN